MNKKIYCLAGLHRSGNTLLASILRQNPDIYVSPLSPFSEYLDDQYQNTLNNLHLKASGDYDGSDALLRSMATKYYEHIDKPVIFDREKHWGVPKYFFLAKTYIDEDIKMVFTKRPTLEILASLIVVMGKTLNKQMDDLGYVWKSYLSENDNKCDFLMGPLWYLDSLFSTYTTMQNYPDHFHVIEYNDLMQKPKETLDELYGFLQLETYNHTFDNIENPDDYKAEFIGLPANLHTVKPKLEKTPIVITDVLSDYAINKYADR